MKQKKAISESFAAVLQKMTSSSVEGRYQDCAEVLDALKHI